MSNLSISEATYNKLKSLATLTGLPMQTVLDQAVEAYRKVVFLEKLNADFAALRANPEAWTEEQAERKLWENSLSDGLSTEGEA